MLSVVKMPLKGEVGSRALKSHGNNITDHGKSWAKWNCFFFNSCGNPEGHSGAWLVYRSNSNISCEPMVITEYNLAG